MEKFIGSHFLKLASLLCVVGIFICVNSASAHELNMTINDLFKLAEQSNVDIKVARHDVEISKEQKKSALAERLPDISISATMNYLGNATIMERDFSGWGGSHMPHLGNSLSLSAYQPLYTGGEITAKINKAKNRQNIAENELTQISNKKKILILEYFLNLFKQRNLLSVYEENIELTRRLISEMRVRSKQGLALSNDVTRYELNLSNLNYDRTTVIDDIDYLNNSLLSFLDLDKETVIVPTLHFADSMKCAASSDIWMEYALQNSPDLKKTDLSYAQTQLEEKLLRSKKLPKIGFKIGDDLEGPITNRSPILNKNINRWWVGVQLSFNISAPYKERGNIAAARLESSKLLDQRKSLQDEIERQLDRAYKDYTEAFEQVKTQEINVKLAKENYRIVNLRYSNDFSLLTDMLDASAQKLDAEVRLVNARTNAIYYYYQLKYISGTL